ncbi:MAG: diaminopimelate decarboxylase [Chloroflexi bacterium]|nr:diaminopimelate decarboxylase [Chloroflexota bacterium]
MSKTPPFSKSQIEEISKTLPTPFYLYDEMGMRKTMRAFLSAFGWNGRFKNYFAVKATPTPALLKILLSEGLGLDCSSMAELVLAEKLGVSGDQIMFTSNNTPAVEFQKARQLGAIINLDDLSHLSFLEAQAGLPELICFRYNPGGLKSGNRIIGEPKSSKFGVTREQLFEGYRMARDKGITRFGLHTMVASNELNPTYFVETAQLLFELVVELTQSLGIRFEFVNLGGGLGVPYELEQRPLSLHQLSDGIRQQYEQVIVANGLHPLRVCMENGRFITGPHGYLITRVRHIKQTYKQFVGVDATMADLMRPGLYGAYHHMCVLGKEGAPADAIYDVTGSLCENNDKFAIDRKLPMMARGDLVVIYDVGAHGHAMGFNYNGKLRPAELLLRENGDVVQIRRAETLQDYFATVDFEM